MAAADKACSALVDAMIAAGRGHERPTETCKLADPLALRYTAALERYTALGEERRRRMEWHGSLLPIRKM